MKKITIYCHLLLKKAHPNASIEIFDVMGVKVLSDVRHLEDVGHLIWIDVSHLPAGVYFVKIGESIGAFSIENNNGASPIASIEIFDVMGVKVISDVRHLKDVGHLNRIDVSHIPAGVYFVKIGESIGACSIVEKFVKKR